MPATKPIDGNPQATAADAARDPEIAKLLAVLEGRRRQIGDYSDPDLRERAAYGEEAAGLFNSIMIYVGRDYRGLYRQGVLGPNKGMVYQPIAQSVGRKAAPSTVAAPTVKSEPKNEDESLVYIVDNIMVALFARAMGREDVAKELYETCNESRDTLTYSAPARALFSVLSGREEGPKAGLMLGGEYGKWKKIQDILFMIRAVVFPNSNARVEGEAPSEEELGKSLALAALWGTELALCGSADRAKKVLTVIHENFKKSENNLYMQKGEPSTTFCTAAMGLFLCVLAGADLKGKNNVLSIVKPR